MRTSRPPRGDSPGHAVGGRPLAASSVPVSLVRDQPPPPPFRPVPNASSMRFRTPRRVTLVARVIPESIPASGGDAVSPHFFSSCCSAARTSLTNAAGGGEASRHRVAQPDGLRVRLVVPRSEDVLGLRRGHFHPGVFCVVGCASACQASSRACVTITLPQRRGRRLRPFLEASPSGCLRARSSEITGRWRSVGGGRTGSS